MLVLSRRAAETFEFPVLGIRVEVLRCSSNSVRIGIDAPRDIQVLRGELVDTTPTTNFRRFQETMVPEVSLQNMSTQLQTQINDAATTLNQLQVLSEANDVPIDGDAISELTTMLGQIDRRSRQLAVQSDTPRQLRALLVDDNDNESRLLASYLKVKGLAVTTASNGQEAIAKLAFDEPDVVLLDMTMPEFDGRWTIDQIRDSEELAKLTVFAVSGICETESGVEVGPNGVNAWFQKPLNPETLATEIERNCRIAVGA